jgi:CheY-like chemotaxis protein
MAKILIAEDEKDIRDLVKFALEVGGHTVVAVSNGADAVTGAREHLPDLILLDMRMPRLTGLEACTEIKADPDTNHIPVVFLSGKEADEEREAQQTAGAVGFINKPFDPMQLQIRVNEILNQIGTA